MNPIRLEGFTIALERDDVKFRLDLSKMRYIVLLF
jgi:hypothetical protein